MNTCFLVTGSPLYAWLHFFTDFKTQSLKAKCHVYTRWKPDILQWTAQVIMNYSLVKSWSDTTKRTGGS